MMKNETNNELEAPRSSESESESETETECYGNGSFYLEDYTQSSYVRTVLYVLYVVVMVVAIVGNQIIIWSILLKKQMRTATNLYILNLAVADFLTALVVMPLKMIEDLGDCEITKSIMTRSTCAVASYLMPVIVFASVLTLICISIERFIAVVYPLASRKLNSACRSRSALIFCWLVPAIICTPFLAHDGAVFNMHSEYGTISRMKCQSRDWTIFGYELSGAVEFAYAVFLLIVVYAVPAIIIVVTSVCIAVSLRRESRILTRCDSDCSSANAQSTYNGVSAALRKQVHNKNEEHKKRVAKMVNFVALFFLFSWTPFYVLNLLTLHTDNIPHHLFKYLVAHLLGFVNAAVSPIICFIMSERFRLCLLEAVHICLFCSPRLRDSWLAASKRIKTRRSFSSSTYTPISRSGGSTAIRKALSVERGSQPNARSMLLDQPSTSQRDVANLVALAEFENEAAEPEIDKSSAMAFDS